jgi:hypothetical protein
MHNEETSVQCHWDICEVPAQKQSNNLVSEFES